MASQDFARLVQLFARATRPVLITGGGLSAAAGLATFSGPDGGSPATDALIGPLDSEDWETRPDEVAAHIASIAAASDATSPSAAHRAIAEYQRACGARGGIATVTTLNVDDLHERSGAYTHHLHGRAHYTKCEACDGIFAGAPRECSSCGGQTRPDVVLFGERLDPLGMWETRRALRDTDAVIVIGMTSGSWQVQRWVRFVTVELRVPSVLITNNPDADFASLFSVVVDDEVAVLEQLFAAELTRT